MELRYHVHCEEGQEVKLALQYPRLTLPFADYSHRKELHWYENVCDWSLLFAL